MSSSFRFSCNVSRARVILSFPLIFSNNNDHQDVQLFTQEPSFFDPLIVEQLAASLLPLDVASTALLSCCEDTKSGLSSISCSTIILRLKQRTVLSSLTLLV
ncbi:hypothetical protein DY000_02042759 [Brassica cretica]|uniref:Uncharacterized protein n=3 Tax=Brassica TaxID=3705 RepID=A0A0D3AD42_BRAOL|nr:hypothetical protein DY000_02042759 [Brassica cretica]VDD52356.1 unnamed protein product [Brassica oleracea]